MATNNAANNKTASSGKVLQGQGVGTASDFSTATYPSTATGTGKILRADGTNWVASTATYPDTAGTSGNVLTSDGTNWISSNQSSRLITVSGQLTSSQIKALHATPIEAVAAPGAGNLLLVNKAIFSYVYGGSNVFVAGAAQNIQLYLGAATALVIAVSNGTLVGTANLFTTYAPTPSTNPSTYDNLNLNFYNPVVTEISGNAANDNRVNYTISYFVIDW